MMGALAGGSIGGYVGGSGVLQKGLSDSTRSGVSGVGRGEGGKGAWLMAFHPVEAGLCRNDRLSVPIVAFMMAIIVECRTVQEGRKSTQILLRWASKKKCRKLGYVK